MLKNGEKGAVLQRDRETYAIAPHTPCGIITPGMLRKIADVSEKYGAEAIKITSANRIAIIGVKEEDVDAAWQDLGMSKGHLVGLCVRSVRACPGDKYCKLGQRDSLCLGLKLDETYHGMPLPGKLKMAVSGCPINCAEGWVRDIGFYARGKSMWVMVAGGTVGSRPRMADELARGLDDEMAISATAKVVEFYKQNAKRGERMGRMIDRIGIDKLKQLAQGG